MKKKLCILAGCILLCASCGTQVPDVHGITYSSIDMPGEITGDAKQTTAMGQDNYQGTSGAPPAIVTAAPNIPSNVVGTSQINSDGDFIVVTCTTEPVVISGPEETTVATKSWETPSYQEPVYTEETMPQEPTIENIDYLTVFDLEAYYDGYDSNGWYKDNGEKLSFTGELISLADNTYANLITSYTDKYLSHDITLHYGDHYETYWFVDDWARSVLQVGDTVYVTYSKLNPDNSGIVYDSTPIEDLHEGTYDSVNNVEGKLLGMFGDVFHTDYYHTIFVDKENRKYIIYDKFTNKIFIQDKTKTATYMGE